MVKGTLKSELMFSDRLLLLGKLLGLVASLGLILGAFSVWFNAHQRPSAVSGVPALAATASTVDPNIKIQFETIKPDGTGENYFVNYRLKREQFRQETKAMLSELLNSSVEKTKAQAQEKWLELSTKIQREDEIENLLKIKGCKDVVADVNPDNVTLIVYAPSLTLDEVSLIQTIVVRETNIQLAKIMISVEN
ncbi:SpoIIIAH-like family protein [Desulfosporosinus sp. PR]|uniref:SpoIIIAH-like family protein n=1 Tax=Candidatus Desulfosporosinus nitrosoreducens TaxID=3401928 RepID=UPI0027E5D268|nr:SpoIIIAH-like family protein [Desulfosporosinus sp. PR]MDQ7095785.1 SpoIIIAH-like family protein [Desulfosporosinus sp. PR]